MSDYYNNEEKNNDIGVNEYGEKIAPKNNAALSPQQPRTNQRTAAYNKRTPQKQRPALPPRGVSPAAFSRQQALENRQPAEKREKGFFKPFSRDRRSYAAEQNNSPVINHEEKASYTQQPAGERERTRGSRYNNYNNSSERPRYNKRYNNESPNTDEAQNRNTVVSHSNHKAVKRTPLKIIPLGGLNEIGKNMTLFECGNDMFIVDCGLAFPDSDMPGVDIVIPDFTYVEQNADKIKGIVITHGHEDHIGSLAYLLKKVNIPVYGTRLTIGLIEGKLKEHNLVSQTKLNVVTPRQTVKMGCMAVEFIRVNHSIPDAVALAIHTPAGIVIHTGDFKVDYTPIDGGIIDLARFGELGSRGVLALMSDSTNAERPGHTESERKVGESFEKLFAKAEGRRIIIATFASNIHRIQQIINNAVVTDRKVAVFGRSMLNVISAAMEMGYLSVPEGIIIDIETMNKYPPEKIVLITTGSQGEPMSALTRMAMNEHRSVTITPMDYIIISATPIPGNEKFVTRVVNELLKAGAEVVYEAMYDVHVSGHACQEEIKLIMALTRPRFFIPVHGEYKHLKKAAAIARSMGIPENCVLIGTIGDVIETDGSSINVTGKVPSGRVLVDGLGVGDVGSIVLRDRKHLAEDGLIVVVATIESESGTILAGPDILSRGFVYVRESEEMMDAARDILRRSLESCLTGGVRDWNSIKSSMRDALSDYIYMKTKRNPMILPIIEEI